MTTESIPKTPDEAPDFDAIAERQGWNDGDVANVLRDYIDNQADAAALRDFAAQRAYQEDIELEGRSNVPVALLRDPRTQPVALAYIKAQEAYWDAQTAFRHQVKEQIARLIPEGYTSVLFEMDEGRLRFTGTAVRADDSLDREFSDTYPDLNTVFDLMIETSEYSDYEDARSVLFRTEDYSQFRVDAA